MEKEKGNHLLDETLEELLNNQNNVENTIEQNKSTYQKWRP
jgi:hypothetical protein